MIGDLNRTRAGWAIQPPTECVNGHPLDDETKLGPVISTSAAERVERTIREARVLISASAASQVGDWLYNAALLGYVFSATHSAAWVGAATIGAARPASASRTPGVARIGSMLR